MIELWLCNVTCVKNSRSYGCLGSLRGFQQSALYCRSVDSGVVILVSGYVAIATVVLVACWWRHLVNERVPYLSDSERCSVYCAHRPYNGIARPWLSPPLMVNLAVTLRERPKDLKDPLIRRLPEPLLFPCDSSLELYHDWRHCHLFRLNSIFYSIKNHTSCLLLERYSCFLTLLWFRQKYIKSLQTIYFKFYLAYIYKFRYAFAVMNISGSV